MRIAFLIQVVAALQSSLQREQEKGLYKHKVGCPLIPNTQRNYDRDWGLVDLEIRNECKGFDIEKVNIQLAEAKLLWQNYQAKKTARCPVIPNGARNYDRDWSSVIEEIRNECKGAASVIVEIQLEDAYSRWRSFQEEKIRRELRRQLDRMRALSRR